MQQNFAFIDNLTLEEREYLTTVAALSQLTGMPTPTDLEEWAHKTLQQKREEEERVCLAQKHKEAKKQQKAAALNMTYEQYEEYRKKQQRISRYKSEIRKCEKQIVQTKKSLAYWENKLQEAEKE